MVRTSEAVQDTINWHEQFFNYGIDDHSLDMRGQFPNIGSKVVDSNNYLEIEFERLD